MILLSHLPLKRLVNSVTNWFRSAKKIKKGFKMMAKFLLNGLCIAAGGFLAQTTPGGVKA
jgi:hypothetical protein